MAIVSVFGGAFCHDREIAIKVAERLWYSLIDELLIDTTARRFDISVEKINRALTGQSSLFDKFTRQRRITIAALRLVLAEMIVEDKQVVVDYPALLVSREISHALRI